MPGDKKPIITSKQLQNIIDSYEGPGPIKFAEELDKGGYSRDIQGVNIDLFNEKLKLDESSFEGCDIIGSEFVCHDYFMNYDFYDFFKKTNRISHLTLCAWQNYMARPPAKIIFRSKNLFFNSENISNHKWLIETYDNMSAMDDTGVCLGTNIERIRHFLKFHKKIKNLNEDILSLDGLGVAIEKTPDRDLKLPVLHSKSTQEIIEGSNNGQEMLSNINSEIQKLREEKDSLLREGPSASWMHKINKKIFQKKSERFAKRVQIYQNTLQGRSEYRVSVPERDLENKKIIEYIFGNEDSPAVFGDSNAVLLGFNAHAVSLIKQDNGKYEIYDPSYALFQDISQEHANEIIIELVRLYAGGEKQWILVTNIEKLIKDMSIVDSKYLNRDVDKIITAEDAVAHHDNDKLDTVLQNLNKEEIDDNKLLHYAVKISNAYAVEKFLDKGASVLISDNDKKYILTDYSLSGNLAKLIGSVKNGQGMNGLHYIAFCDKGENRESNFKSMIEAGVDVNLADDDQKTPLHRAVMHNRPELVRLLLASKVIDVDKKDKSGFTPLHHAIASNNPECVRMLCNAGADIYIQNNNGLLSPFTLSQRGKGANDNSREIAEFLKELDISRTLYQITQIHKLSVRPVDFHELNRVLESAHDKNAVINVGDSADNTPLHKAIVCKNWEAAMYLMENGAKVDVKALRYAYEAETDSDIQPDQKEKLELVYQKVKKILLEGVVVDSSIAHSPYGAKNSNIPQKVLKR